MIKNLPAMQETCVQSLGWKDPLETEMATHSSVLAWEIPWTQNPGGLWFTGSQKSLTQPSDCCLQQPGINNKTNLKTERFLRNKETFSGEALNKEF